MTLKLNISIFFQKFWMPWKSIYRLLLIHTIDPVSFSSIGQVVFKQWSFKVLKSIGSIRNLQFSIVILVFLYMWPLDNRQSKTCNFSKQKHMDPVRTTPRMYGHKPIEKFILKFNEWLVNVMASTEPMEKFKANSNEWLVNPKIKSWLLGPG